MQIAKTSNEIRIMQLHFANPLGCTTKMRVDFIDLKLFYSLNQCVRCFLPDWHANGIYPCQIHDEKGLQKSWEDPLRDSAFLVPARVLEIKVLMLCVGPRWRVLPKE